MNRAASVTPLPLLPTRTEFAEPVLRRPSIIMDYFQRIVKDTKSAYDALNFDWGNSTVPQRIAAVAQAISQAVLEPSLSNQGCQDVREAPRWQPPPYEPAVTGRRNDHLPVATPSLSIKDLRGIPSRQYVQNPVAMPTSTSRGSVSSSVTTGTSTRSSSGSYSHQIMEYRSQHMNGGSTSHFAFEARRSLD